MLRFAGKIGAMLVGTALVSALGFTPAAAWGGTSGSYGSTGGYGSGQGSYSQQSSTYGQKSSSPSGKNTYNRMPSSQYGQNSYRPKPSSRYGGYGNNAYGNRGGYDYGSGRAVVYWVTRGDTLRSIAARFGTSIAALLRSNPGISNPDRIFAGQKLLIPRGSGGYGKSYGYGQSQAPGYGMQQAPGYGMQQAPGYGMQQPGYGQSQAPAPKQAPAPAPAPAPGRQTVTLDLTARNMSFSMSTITVPAGAHVVVHFHNQDAMPHNLAVYRNSSAAQAIFQGAVLMGPADTTYEFDAPAQAGTFFFRCDVHPAQMNGQFVVR